MPDLNQLERRVFSQNGEDGIIEFLAAGIRRPNRCFVEIGTADGAQNNTRHLLALGWIGLGVEADPSKVARYAALVRGTDMERRLTLAAVRIDRDNCIATVGDFLRRSPDFFSLDIDGIDYYVAQRLMHAGFAPSIVCCEYNPFLGPEPITVTYDTAFARYGYDRERGLYYGASLAAWRHLFGAFGYRFCCVESAGVNAFFCREAAFESDFLGAVSGLAGAYTAVFVHKYRLSGEKLQAELLARPGLEFIDVTRLPP